MAKFIVNRLVGLLYVDKKEEGSKNNLCFMVEDVFFFPFNLLEFRREQDQNPSLPHGVFNSE